MALTLPGSKVTVAKPVRSPGVVLRGRSMAPWASAWKVRVAQKHSWLRKTGQFDLVTYCPIVVVMDVNLVTIASSFASRASSFSMRRC